MVDLVTRIFAHDESARSARNIHILYIFYIHIYIFRLRWTHLLITTTMLPIIIFFSFRFFARHSPIQSLRQTRSTSDRLDEC